MLASISVVFKTPINNLGSGEIRTRDEELKNRGMLLVYVHRLKLLTNWDFRTDHGRSNHSLQLLSGIKYIHHIFLEK